jgi:phosphate transport system substrate-binding protein
LFKRMRPFALVVGAVLAASMLSGCVLNVVGSDTTSNYMGAIAPAFNADSAANPSANNVRNAPPTLANGGSFAVPGDFDAASGLGCPGFSYTNPGNLPPNGSSSGISALLADTQTCVDIARSSRGRGSEGANIDFWAFATDGVTWARYGGSSAPANLTLAQIRGIYLCDQPGGNPLYTNWNQLGGANAPIIRYLAQAGSGTQSFFETKILGLSSAQQGVLDDTACTGNPLDGRVQENKGNDVPLANRPNAILPYSFGVWTAQSNNAEPDTRAGAVLGNINGVAPTITTVGLNGAFFGKRYVYNVVKNTALTHVPALELIGVQPAKGSTPAKVGYICKNNSNTSFAKAVFGFVPLPNGATGPGLPSSTCRKNPTPL